MYKLRHHKFKSPKNDKEIDKNALTRHNSEYKFGRIIYF